jgi:hypothetical protein
MCVPSAQRILVDTHCIYFYLFIYCCVEGQIPSILIHNRMQTVKMFHKYLLKSKNFVSGELLRLPFKKVVGLDPSRCSSFTLYSPTDLSLHLLGYGSSAS